MILSEQLPVSVQTYVDALSNANRANRLAHAFLIQCDSVTLREDFALFLAQLGACAHPDEHGNACGACDSCTQLSRHAYAELHILTPEGKMQEIKVGALNNPEENSVRGFCSKFYLTSLDSSAHKVGIIYDADRMNEEAQNALLKTLEEPPPNSLLILCTGKAGSLLPTTKSRCQLITLSTSKFDYDFADQEELYKLLAGLFGANGDLNKCSQAADSLVDLFARIKSQSDTEVEAEFESKLSEAASLDDRALKLTKERAQATADGRYLRMRGEVLSAFKVFFDQLYLLSEGAQINDLPNPEIFAKIELPESVDYAKAARAADVADRMVNSFRFTVNEALALRAAAFGIGMDK